MTSETEKQESGYGTFKFDDGSEYEGNWILLNNKKIRNGEGTLIQPYRESYTGNWVNDQMEGYGVYNYTSGARYQGQWKAGKTHGKGIYEFQDGSIYDGEWAEHKMHGEGCYIDRDSNKWEGVFVNGVYQSKIQEQLKQEKIQNLKKQAVSDDSKTLFSRFINKFQSSDKKTFKENLNPFFVTQEEIQIIYSGNITKFEDKQPQQWADFFTKFSEEHCKINVLANPTETVFLDSAQITAPQLQGNGQLVEFERSNKSGCVLCNVNQRWAIVTVIDE